MPYLLQTWSQQQQADNVIIRQQCDIDGSKLKLVRDKPT